MGERFSQGDVVTAISSLQAVLAAIDAGELSCSAAYRNRLQGAVVALQSRSMDLSLVSDASGGPA